MQDERGWPVAGAKISIVPLRLFSYRDRGIETDADGHFAADVSPGLETIVTARARGSGLRADERLTVTGPAELRLVLQPYRGFCRTSH